MRKNVLKRIILISMFCGVLFLTACNDGTGNSISLETEAIEMITSEEIPVETNDSDTSEETANYSTSEELAEETDETDETDIYDYEFVKLKHLQNDGVSTFEELEPDILDGIDYEKFKAVCEIFHASAPNTNYRIAGQTAFFEPKEDLEGYYFARAWLDNVVPGQSDSTFHEVGYRIYIEGYNQMLKDYVEASARSSMRLNRDSEEILVETEDTTILMNHFPHRDYVKYTYKMIRGSTIINITVGDDTKENTTNKELIDGLVEEMEELFR